MPNLFFTLWLTYFLFRLNVYGATNCKNCSIYQNPISRIFARKKRFIVFPNYAAMKITVATGKSLIAIYPKGVNLSLEASVYYPLPTVLEEWYPKKYRSSTTPKPKPSPRRRKKPTTKPPAEMMHQIASMQMNNPMDMGMHMHHIPLHSESGVIWMPDSGWSTNINSTLGNIGSMNKVKTWSRGDHFYSHKHYQPNYAPFRTWNRQENYKYLPNKQYSYLTDKDWRHHLNKDIYSSKIHPNWHIDEHYNKPIDYSPEFDSYHDWKYFKAHRERRDIYTHFETFTSHLGIDIKSCILRSICETKTYLLPPGYSLIQDILRIIFSIPTLDGVIDEYSKAMRNDKNDCMKSYRKVCPISLLDFILNPDKIKF